MEKLKNILLCLLLVVVGCAQDYRDGSDATNMANGFVASVPTQTAESSKGDASSGFDPATKVFVCKSTGAKKYHFKESCGGLKQCTHQVVTMTVKEAEGKGLGLCGWED